MRAAAKYKVHQQLRQLQLPLYYMGDKDVVMATLQNNAAKTCITIATTATAAATFGNASHNCGYSTYDHSNTHHYRSHLGNCSDKHA